MCTCGPNTTLKFQIDFSKIGRGFAELPFFVRYHLTYTESIFVTIFRRISWVVNLAMKLLSTFFRFILLRTGKVKLDTDSHAMLFHIIQRIFTEASGYLVLNIITFGQNRVLWGLFVGKYVPPRYYHRKNLTKCFFCRPC